MAVAAGQDHGMMGMDVGGMITMEAVGIMKEDKPCLLKVETLSSKTSFRYSLMKLFVRAICIVCLGFISIFGVGSFSTASAGGSDGYYQGHRDRHHRYRRAYDHCASRYRVGGHRFERCMDYSLGEYRRW